MVNLYEKYELEVLNILFLINFQQNHFDFS